MPAKKTPSPTRPLGVTNLALLAFVSGVFNILLSLGAAGLGGLLASSQAQAMLPQGSPVPSLGITVILLGVLGLGLGLAQIVFGVGALQLKPWAWLLGTVLQFLSVANVVIGWLANGFDWTRILPLAFNAIILWYLYRPHVKAAFQQA